MGLDLQVTPRAFAFYTASRLHKIGIAGLFPKRLKPNLGIVWKASSAGAHYRQEALDDQPPQHLSTCVGRRRLRTRQHPTPGAGSGTATGAGDHWNLAESTWLRGLP